MLIHTSAGDYGALDFKVAYRHPSRCTCYSPSKQQVTVTQEAIEHVRQLYIEPDNVVFDLLPAPLSALIDECYVLLGSPAVHRGSIWTIYLQLLEHLQRHAELAPVLTNVDASLNDVIENDDVLPLLGGLAELPESDYYMGGVGNGEGLRE